MKDNRHQVYNKDQQKTTTTATQVQRASQAKEEEPQDSPPSFNPPCLPRSHKPGLDQSPLRRLQLIPHQALKPQRDHAIDPQAQTLAISLLQSSAIALQLVPGRVQLLPDEGQSSQLGALPLLHLVARQAQLLQTNILELDQNIQQLELSHVGAHDHSHVGVIALQRRL